MYAHVDAETAYKEYEKRLKAMHDMKPAKVTDTSDMAEFTTYESQLNIRNVHLEEYEDRLKRFVFKTQANERKSLPSEVTTIKKKQLQIAFAGNKYLEAMLNDKTSLDWRLLM